MSQHTPGPFDAVQCSADHRDTWSVVAGMTTIAKCAIPGKLGALRNRENAMLLAAAPDTAHAAKDFLRWFRTFVGEPTYNDIRCDELDALRAALAKAGV